VHERRRFQRLARLLLSQLLRRQLAQFVVDQRQQLISSLCIAAFRSWVTSFIDK
jgi:hypothetical protein